MIGLRWREDTGYEGRCDECRQWWPLDDDTWIRRYGFRRCRACINAERAAYVNRLRVDNPEMRAIHRERSRENQAIKRRLSRDAYLEYQRRWWAKNHVRLMAEAAERHAIQSEMAAKKPRRSSRIETKETLAYRADFRRRWIERFGPVVGPAIVIAPEMLDPEMKKAARRAYNRAWMRRNRAEKAA